MDKEKYYKYMFFSGVIYNLVAGAIFGILPVIFDRFLPFFGIEHPSSFVFLHLVILLIWGLALSYFLAMKDLTKARNAALVGGVTKILAFILALIYLILDLTTSVSGCNWIMVLVMAPDLIQGSMFLEFYFRYDKFE